ncbi:hypothetical protein D3C87_1306280 [compost metagenome]
MSKFPKLTPSGGKTRKLVLDEIKKHYDEGMKRTERTYMLQQNNHPHQQWNQWYQTLKSSWRDISRDPMPKSISMDDIDLLVWELEIFKKRLAALKYYLDHPRKIKEHKSATLLGRFTKYITSNVKHPDIVTKGILTVLGLIGTAALSFVIYVGAQLWQMFY